MDDSEAPEIKSMPPTPLPIGSSRCYRWTSYTAARNSLYSDFSPISSRQETPVSVDVEATWRKAVPRGRIRDLVAAFDQCARPEDDHFKKPAPPPPKFHEIPPAENFKTPQISTPKRPSSAEKRAAPPKALDLNKLEPITMKTSPLAQRHQNSRRGTQAVVFKSSPLASSAPESLFPANIRKMALKKELEPFIKKDCSVQVMNTRGLEDFWEREVSEDSEASLEDSEASDEPMELDEESKTADRTFDEPDYLSDKENIAPVFPTSDSSASPKFTSSPSLFTPYAGQPVTEYRVTETEGPHKVVKQQMPPAALATSTPFGTMNRGGGGIRRGGADEAQFQNSFVSSISNFSAVDHANDSRRQISRLLESIDKTRHHIQLAEISLLEAKKSRVVVQELSSQRVLLCCRERLKLQLEEIRRLQALAVVRHPPPPINRQFKSTMVISNISLQINKNFHSRSSFAFIVVLKCRTEVEATGVVTLLAQFQTRLNTIQFGEHLHFSNLPVDFVIGVEIYMMKVPEYKPPERNCAAFLAEKVRNLFVPSHAAHRRPTLTTTTTIPNTQQLNKTSISLPSTNHTSPECEFKLCGKLTLDRDSAGGDRQFYLDDVIYPLEGTVKLNSHCSSLPEAIDVEYRGYLHLFHDPVIQGASRGLPTWHRYWAMLHRGIVFFWSTPTDEMTEKSPLSQIDLTKCTNQSIEETMREKTGGAEHEFHIELLIDHDPSLLEKRRVILAAESSDHLSSWLNAINDTLYVLRS
ncbi:CRE-ANI-3 protein [Caenorhabditis remanei]|uniref:CRE-ANI-3 protein n=1 Tax=Caenorhabditis remanei TaxID=31234 RepID=E3N6G0_CAERE|nr:CRE-ANI-3 protein [Caenorhabditis remanei]